MKIESKVVVSDVLKTLSDRSNRNDEALQTLINYVDNDSSEDNKNNLRMIASEMYENFNYQNSLSLSDLRILLSKMISKNDDPELFSNDDILRLAMVLQMVVLDQPYSEEVIDSICEIAFIYTHIVFISAELNTVYDGSLSKRDLSQSWIVELSNAVSKRRDMKKVKKAIEDGQNEIVVSHMKSVKIESFISSEVDILIYKARLIIDQLETDISRLALELEQAVVSWISKNDKLQEHLKYAKQCIC